MAYAIAIPNNKLFFSPFMPARSNFFSNIHSPEYTTTRDYISSINIPEGYPEINPIALVKANRLCDDIELQSNVSPTRTTASIEGGVAIVYSKNSGIFKKKHKEVFIEVYNDNDVIISFTENYKLKRISEVTTDNESIVSDYIKEIL